MVVTIVEFGVRARRSLPCSIAWACVMVAGCTFDTSPIFDPRGAAARGGTSGEAGRGDDGSVPDDAGTSCRPDAFIECRDDVAIRCAADGQGYVEQDCGGPGCDMVEGGCNACMAGETLCADATTLATCGEDGSFEGDQTCAHGCNDDEGGARCNACEPNAILGCADGRHQLRCKADGSESEALACEHVCSGDGVCSVCQPNVPECLDADTLRTCDDAGGGFEDEQACPYGCGEGTGAAACNACTPGVTECQADDLVQCSASGTVMSRTACPFGCDTAQDRCTLPLLLPSNLPAEACSAAVSTGLEVAANGSLTIDTDGPCDSVVDQSGTNNPPDICVLRYATVAIGENATVKVTGGRALALVSTGAMSLAGTLDASGDGVVGGSGASTGGSGVGGDGSAMGDPVPGENLPANAGGGGGGFATAGGHGGEAPGTCPDAPCADRGSGGSVVPVAPGGAAATLSPLRGGSGGGDNSAGSTSSRLARGGGGGGAIQLVACTTLNFTANAVIDVGGAGGEGGVAGDDDSGSPSPTPGAGAGGGSGGGLLIETLVLTSSPGVTVTLAANGGGGGGGATRTGSGSTGFVDGSPGMDAPAAVAAALGGSGAGVSQRGGNGGARDLAPMDGESATTDTAAAGGGGGAAGRIRVNTAGATIGSGLVIASPTASLGSVSVQ